MSEDRLKKLLAAQKEREEKMKQKELEKQRIEKEKEEEKRRKLGLKSTNSNNTSSNNITTNSNSNSLQTNKIENIGKKTETPQIVPQTNEAKWKKMDGVWVEIKAQPIFAFSASRELQNYKTPPSLENLPEECYYAFGISDALSRNSSDFLVALDLLSTLSIQYWWSSQSIRTLLWQDILKAWQLYEEKYRFTGKYMKRMR